MNNRLKPDFLRAPATILVEEFQQRTKQKSIKELTNQRKYMYKKKCRLFCTVQQNNKNKQ